MSVRDTGTQLTPTDGVASQRVGHDHSRHIVQALQTSPEEALCGVGIAWRLNENVECNAALIAMARRR